MAVLRVPGAFARPCLDLRRDPCVRGVFYGQRRRADGTWRTSLGLSVHVERRPASAPLLTTADEGGLARLVCLLRALSRQVLLEGETSACGLGYEALERTERRRLGILPDVIETGGTVTHALDDETLVEAAPAAGRTQSRRASVTALAPAEEGTYALLSGHAALPLNEEGSILHAYAGEPPVAPLLAGGASGRVQVGALGDARPYDFALAWFPGAAASGFHRAANARTPGIPLRSTPPLSGEPVRLWSAVRGRFYAGRVRQISSSPVGFTLPDGTAADFTEVVVLSPCAGSDPAARFSVAGDSGSLVVDGSNRAFAAVLGGSVEGGLSYAVQLRLLAEAHGPDLARFFDLGSWGG